MESGMHRFCSFAFAFVFVLFGSSAPALAAHRASVDRDALASLLTQKIADAKAAGFSGSVLIADGDNVLFERQVGVADPATGAQVTADTRFNMASTGKLFTTVSVLQLVQAGKLDLDAPVGRYLPDWPVQQVRDGVTLRQLLLHTSGLKSYWGPDFTARRAMLRTLADYRPLLATEPAFAPGSQWQYSNIGFQLLGLIIEAASGQSYYDYVAAHIFRPASMRDSGYFEMDGQAPRVAVPRRGGTGSDHDDRLPVPEPRGGAAGGGYSTPRDLLRFHRALTGGVLLDARHLDLLFAPVTLPPGTRAPPHGLGMLRYAVDDDVAYGHPGGAPGVGVDFRGLRRAGWTVIVMSNSDAPRTMPLAGELLKLVNRAGGPDLSFPMPAAGVRIGG
jgi:CubicO group peptidase (beta-lactamase class C family)